MYSFYGNEFKVECPTGSGKWTTLFDVAKEISSRLARILLRNSQGRRPVYGGAQKFHNDPHWRDLILFYEYFHGDNGAGLGASHQTGWTGLISAFTYIFSRLKAEDVLDHGIAGLFDTIPKHERIPTGEEPKIPNERPAAIPKTPSRLKRSPRHAPAYAARSRKPRSQEHHGDGD